jgi:tRNA-Thr(GGU) m(6)t(6)A37 methyltransferase TsaA
MIIWLFIVVLLMTLPVTAAAGEAEQMSQKEFTLRPIGLVEKDGERTTLVLDDDAAPALLGLDGFSHVWVFWWFDANDTPEKRAVRQVHPRGDRDNPLTGVFACRSPARPNLIALTLCRVLSVKGNVVEIDRIDAFDKTPLLDLKPYIPGYDSAEASVPDWVGRPERGRGPEPGEDS